jgi:hypothetical protein
MWSAERKRREDECREKEQIPRKAGFMQRLLDDDLMPAGEIVQTCAVRFIYHYVSPGSAVPDDIGTTTRWPFRSFSNQCFWFWSSVSRKRSAQRSELHH